MIILSSPSGAGKTTLVKLLSERKGFLTSIYHTTRTPRSNEVDGKDYHFVNNDKFQKMINNKEFLEYAKVFKNYYGSLKKNVFDRLNDGKNVIFDIDWQGTKQIKSKKLKYKIITIFILPPSKEELFKRLLKREQKDKNIANERMKQFKEDVLHWKDYDFTVINDRIEKCYKSIIHFIKTNKKNKLIKKYNKSFIKKHIQYLIN